ncbi:hypothetical protein CAOG_08633 [Capsaspora owczarzaki ATCC 30864]|uniref:PDZ domain-containing protein n=1 Tax=Capsaspora owczarzaki (strain ATCC 30864) TaxID=595528 RepID=A0A0D2VN74_CAPO3|nr:hypothetical protein CAOG_08633 [Capsaspora owczarzaki ATCC 30864]KJE91712.1 hypothetical protein CAOG_008633 [Capsaspora owczarzaki ATCC 30864]|eukprot:XP_011270244.1 hypothetical protein CAOG_08633 [Capsaspora owczarzaki ATCC 30864]
MSLYPTIESLTMSNMAQAQAGFVQNVQGAITAASHGQPSQAILPAGSLYAGLYSDIGLDDYMGISLALAEQQNSMQLAQNQPKQLAEKNPNNAVALTQAQAGFKRAEVKNGVRQVSICKDAAGKIGITVQAINKGVFVSCVWKNSSAALAGIRVGDQIIQIDSETVAGYSNDKILKIFKNANPARIDIVLRDRPFERTITLTKNSTDHLGFVFKKGKITQIAAETSAARNGLLTEHHFLEVNGVNVIGLDDEAIGREIHAAGDIVTLTVMPSVIFETMMKNLSTSTIRKFMDHSVPDL